MVSHTPLWRRSGEGEVCNGELCTDVVAMCWRCVDGAVRSVRCITESYAPMCRGAVMSVKCVMESYALMWQRSVECEVYNGELCTGVLAVYRRRSEECEVCDGELCTDVWRRSDECEVCDGESHTVVAAQWRV